MCFVPQNRTSSGQEMIIGYLPAAFLSHLRSTDVVLQCANTTRWVCNLFFPLQRHCVFSNILHQRALFFFSFSSFQDVVKVISPTEIFNKGARISLWIMKKHCLILSADEELNEVITKKSQIILRGRNLKDLLVPSFIKLKNQKRIRKALINVADV